jgi:SAM-dependent methyltransferase
VPPSLPVLSCGGSADPGGPNGRASLEGAISTDRMCCAWALDNRLRRWLAPPRVELKFLDLEPGQAVADLGAGPGYFGPEILRQIGADGRLVLVDIDEDNLVIARRTLHNDPRTRFVLGSAAGVPGIPSGSVDRVLMSLVLCCLKDKARALSEAWRMLRPGGLALVTYPRGRTPGRRSRRPLRVSAAEWRTLVAQGPWHARSEPDGLWVRRHLLERPRALEPLDPSSGPTS